MAVLTISNENTEAVLTVKNGYLYNWYAIDNASNIANTGWHVPTYLEWQALQTYLGGDTVAGGKMKETGFTYWNSPNTGATNEVGLNVKGSGYRDDDLGGVFADIKGRAEMWSANSWFSAKLICDPRDNGITAYLTSCNEERGASIRLMKDSTTLSHGETGLYTGNDGKVYRTICVGTQEWLADNLMETLYRDASPIPVITDNSAWVADSTGARCVYDNDENNA